MDVEKFRNLTDAELLHQQRELNDQLFRMKFQLKMGQTESLNKIRGLRKDVARILTVLREKQLGIDHHRAAATATPAEEAGAETATATATKKAAHAKTARTESKAKGKPSARAGAKTKSRKK